MKWDFVNIFYIAVFQIHIKCNSTVQYTILTYITQKSYVIRTTTLMWTCLMYTCIHVYIRSTHDVLDAMKCNLSIYGCTARVDLGCFFSFLMYTQSVGLIGRGISPPQGRYLHSQQHKQNKRTDIHTSSTIRTQDPSGRTGEDCSCLRPRSHCDRRYCCCYCYYYYYYYY
jgi:hypothetical protein